MNFILESSFVLVVITLISSLIPFFLRRDLLAFTFISLFIFLFQIIPLIVVLIDGENIFYARQSIFFAGIFLISFYSVYKIFGGNIINTSKILKDNVNYFKKYSSIALYLLTAGIILKIVGGDLVHSSIFLFPWSFPMLYGISDRIFFFGVMLIMVNIYFFGARNKFGAALLMIIFLSIISGSRVLILIPISFFIILHSSLNNAKTMIKTGFLGFLFLFGIIVFIGIYRISADDRIFELDSLVDIFLFRISEFYWPMALIEKIDNNIVSLNPSWIISGFWGIFPASVSDFFTGSSVFSRDTVTMLDVAGLGNIYMSVPMTPIGEGYYWFGKFGVALIGALYGFGFVLVNFILKRMNTIVLVFVILQMYRLTFTLPVAGYPEFISFLSKDIIISLFLAKVIFTIFYLNSSDRIQSTN